MLSIIEYLKDAQLVADFQHFFGIRSLIPEEGNHHGDQCNGKPSSSDSVRTNVKLRQRHRSEAKNESNHDVSNGLSKGPLANHQTKSTKATSKNYVIQNRAFYLIFCLGASLGYEVFYALFFPFVLHNVDSFVGRR